jgi:hypothetical protein
MNLLKLLAQTVVLLILLAVAWVAWVYQDHLTPVAEELVTLYTDWNQNAHWSKPAASKPEQPVAKSSPAPSAATPPATADSEPSSPTVAAAGAPLVKIQPESVTSSVAEPTAAPAPALDSSPTAAPAVAAVPSAAVESGAVPAKPPLGAAPEGTPPSQLVMAQESAPAVPAAAPAVTSAESKTAVTPDQTPRSADTPPPSSQPTARDPGAVLGRGTAPHLSATTVLVANPVEPPVDVLALHARARRAAWGGQTDAAIAAYQQLIISQPQSADAHGELGNVYFQAKRQADAAVEYEKAALLLVDQGDQTRIWQLLQALRGLDAVRARGVEEKLLARGR